MSWILCLHRNPFQREFLKRRRSLSRSSCVRSIWQPGQTLKRAYICLIKRSHVTYLRNPCQCRGLSHLVRKGGKWCVLIWRFRCVRLFPKPVIKAASWMRRRPSPSPCRGLRGRTARVVCTCSHGRTTTYFAVNSALAWIFFSCLLRKWWNIASLHIYMFGAATTML